MVMVCGRVNISGVPRLKNLKTHTHTVKMQRKLQLCRPLPHQIDEAMIHF
ncbi:hypothetical protein C5167_016330 [Papaver somniferum]|nr:hypothetical protein C5167_016330 [Papaver somniferum]